MQKFNTKETNKRSDLSEINTTYEWMFIPTINFSVFSVSSNVIF